MFACTEVFVNLLKSRDIKFMVEQDSEGDDLVSIPFDGKLVRCFFSGDNGEYLALHYYYEDVDEEKVADMIFLCNELNSKYKWVKFLVNSSKNFVVRDDALLSVETAGDEAFELVARMVDIVADEKKNIMRTLYA